MGVGGGLAYIKDIPTDCHDLRADLERGRQCFACFRSPRVAFLVLVIRILHVKPGFSLVAGTKGVHMCDSSQISVTHTCGNCNA